MNHRREFLKAAGLFVVAAACNPEKLLGPCEPIMTPLIPPPVAPYALHEVYVVNDFGGVRAGTRTNPYVAKTAQEFDTLMGSLQSDDIEIHLSGDFKTRGTYEWGTFAYLGWRMGKHWRIEGEGSSLTLDPNAIADGEIDSAPIHLLSTSEQTSFPETEAMSPEQVWAGLPRAQAVRNLTLNASHTALADRWRAKDCVLKTGGVILQGHNAAIESCRFRNFGALKNSTRESAECFPAVICGAMGAPDRDKIARLDPETHVFDSEGEPSHITDCVFEDYAPAASDDQVTVFMIVGAVGEPGGWQTGDWRHTYRRDCHQSGNVVSVSGRNLVQGHTIYQALKGRVSGNRTAGADIGYYGDFYKTKGIEIEDNDFEHCRHGVQLLLSPTAGGDPDLPKSFSHENYAIGANRITSSGANVSLSTLGPSTPTRFIRDISVHPSLSLENYGAENVTRDMRRCA